jgi:predicted Zn-dependent protease
MICARTSAATAFMLLAGACATAPQAPVADLQPGQRPALETDEAGLWMRMDAAEAKLRTSGRLVIDPALNAYMRGVMCRLSAEYCEKLRVYIVRGPHFNATMAPNGTLKVSTGTLLRVQNEAQLAYVLGHEMGHYIRRHSLQRWRNIRSTTDSMARFTNTTRMVGLGFIGNLADMAAMSGVMAFSREHERESDEIGFDLMVRAGYAGEEVPKVWMALEAEHSAAGLHAPSGFLSSHPATDERLATLQARASEYAGRGDKGDERYMAAIRLHCSAWLRDEVYKRDLEGTRVVLGNLLQAGNPVGEIRFLEGELYRLRGHRGDAEQAIAAYRAAVASAGAPPEAHRALGTMYWRFGQTEQARESFRAYLAADPKAEDRAMIETYIQQLD